MVLKFRFGQIDDCRSMGKHSYGVIVRTDQHSMVNDRSVADSQGVSVIRDIRKVGMSFFCLKLLYVFFCLLQKREKRNRAFKYEKGSIRIKRKRVTFVSFAIFAIFFAFVTYIFFLLKPYCPFTPYATLFITFFGFYLFPFLSFL